MSWSKAWLRPALLAALLLPLAGCGFHPLYGEQSTFGYDPTLAAVTVLPIKDRIGQIVEMSLREQFNPRGVDEKPRYVLQVNLNVARTDLAVQLNATSLRSRITLTARYVLSGSEGANGQRPILLSDADNTTTSFNLPGDAYASTVAEQHAEEQAAQDISRDIANKIALFLRQQRGKAG